MDRVWRVVQRLMQHYQERWRPGEQDPFRALVRTILSQNTNFKNEMEAFRNLDRNLGVNPKTLSEASVEEIAKHIRVAGLYRQKSLKIKKVAQFVVEKYDGDLWRVLRLPLEQARRELMSLPGVGPKTADVILLFNAKKHVIPIDRHIFRVSKRLGFVSQDAGYEEVRAVLERNIPERYYEDAHVLLIQFGRDYCRARNPRCGECFLNELCPKIGV